ncbi:hypothetical protein B9K09_01650 [Pseudomonas sp. M30-35]|nr:hypothetical protein B9K09_01650 [Pseudomonas sp. M30-35]
MVSIAGGFQLSSRVYPTAAVLDHTESEAMDKGCDATSAQSARGFAAHTAIISAYSIFNSGFEP